MRLVELQEHARLPKATVHRLLLALIKHGLVARGPDDKRFRLGYELAVLAWSAINRENDLYAQGMHSASALATVTGDTVCLLARSGFDTVCLGRQSGSYPIKALTINVGDRRPLGVGASSVAILAAMTESECARVLQANSRSSKESGRDYSLPKIHAELKRTRTKRYSFSDGMFHSGVRAVAVAIRDFRGDPIAAIVVAAVADRIPNKRILPLAEALMREQARIETALSPSAPLRRLPQAN